MSSAAPSGEPPVLTVPVDALSADLDGPVCIADVQAAARRLLILVRQLPPQGSGDGLVLDLVEDGARCVVTWSRPRLDPGTARHGHGLSPVTALTPREQEIARMVAGGYTNKEIATVLEISSWTVSTHLRRIFGKLNVGTRAAMVARLSSAFPS